MKRMLYILGFVLLIFQVQGQNRRQAAQVREKIDAVKIGFFTREMNLSPEEAEKFWPLYFKYQETVQQQKIERRKAFRMANESLDEMSDTEINQLIDDRIRQAEIALSERQKFVTEIRKVLPVRKVAEYFKAEELFRRKLMEKMNDRKKLSPIHDEMD